MGDLCNRLDELQAVTRVLTKDVQFYREQCNRTEPQEIDSVVSAIHRAYVRAVFALIEALLEQHKCLLLDLHDSGVVAVDPKIVDRLREQKQFMRLKDKIRTLYKAVGVAFSQQLRIDCAGEGWRALADAIKTRDRVTHPKCFQECSVQVWDLDVVQQGQAWFRAVHNEFVRVAREHRTANGWKQRAPISTSAADGRVLVESLAMADIKRAEPKDAACLADLYAKVFEKTGFKAHATPEKRTELIAWLESLCRDGNLLFISDDQGPISLGHYDQAQGEVIAIVTRDGMEGQGYGAAILEVFASAYPMLKLRPVTRGGRALAEKCGFSASKNDASVWDRAPRGHK